MSFSLRIILIVAGVLFFLLLCAQRTVSLKETFVSQEGGFRVLFPSKPDIAVQSLPRPHGDMKIRTYYSKEPINIIRSKIFSVGYFDKNYDANLSKRTADQKLQDMRDGMLLQSGGTLLEERLITTNGFPGKELRIKVKLKLGMQIVLARIFATNTTAFQIMYGESSKVNSERFDLEQARQFLDSFQLLMATGN